ncbi:hypothetical protein [Calothrix sp. NIES-2098]
MPNIKILTCDQKTSLHRVWLVLFGSYSMNKAIALYLNAIAL